MAIEIRIAESIDKSASINSWSSPDGIKVISDFVGVIIWPLLAVAFIILFRKELRTLIGRLSEFEFFGIKGKLQNQLNLSAQAAEQSKGLSVAPTTGEIERAVQVERLASSANSPVRLVTQEVDELAAEYERIRNTMLRGDSRTRRMEVVISKMRTIGIAAYPLRYELSVSLSPGKRLQAIACLQMLPDYGELLDWLADRVNNEKPFVEYHALVALNTAVNDKNASAHGAQVERALSIIKKKAKPPPGSDREAQLEQFVSRAELLQRKLTNFGA